MVDPFFYEFIFFQKNYYRILLIPQTYTSYIYMYSYFILHLCCKTILYLRHLVQVMYQPSGWSGSGTNSTRGTTSWPPLRKSRQVETSGGLSCNYNYHSDNIKVCYLWGMTS